MNYFTQARDKNGFGKYDLEAISISVYTPVSEEETDWYKSLLNTHADWENVKRREIDINGLNVFQIVYSYDFLNPAKKIEELYVSSYFFEKGNSFIEISINSKKENFALYHPAIKKMISSFDLKK